LCPSELTVCGQLIHGEHPKLNAKSEDIPWRDFAGIDAKNKGIDI